MAFLLLLSSKDKVTDGFMIQPSVCIEAFSQHCWLIVSGLKYADFKEVQQLFKTEYAPHK